MTKKLGPSWSGPSEKYFKINKGAVNLELVGHIVNSVHGYDPESG